jgi:hypothetical protein
MRTLRKCFLLAVVASGALLLSARDASAFWGGWYRTGCWYQTYSYPAYTYTYQPAYTYTYQPAYTYTYQPAPTYTYQPAPTYTYQSAYAYPAWSLGYRWGWRLFR